MLPRFPSPSTHAHIQKAPGYLNSGLLGYVTIGYIKPRTHYFGNWSPRVYHWPSATVPEVNIYARHVGNGILGGLDSGSYQGQWFL